VTRVLSDIEPGACGAAESLEAFLGSPLDPNSVISFARAVELDERELYPEHACAALEVWGFHDYYIPASVGGSLRSYDELLSILRVVARRDLTVAIAHCKTFLGSVAVWVGGSPEQQRHTADLVRQRQQLSLALTERTHGSDLLSSDVVATRVEGGYELSGEKWLINNATRSAGLTVFARTDPQGGPRGFSIFLVEKRTATTDHYAHLPRLKTLGIRGGDFSGIRLENFPVEDTALIGGEGGGLELTLKSLQITRTLCAGLSLGAADTALRSVMDFAMQRRLYGDTVFAIPHAQRLLVDAFVDTLICDAVSRMAVRAIHVVPEQMSLISSIAKCFVPTTIERTLHELSVVLGARFYLRADHQWNHFQKLLRDSALVSLFDGSTVVNLTVILQQLRQLAEARNRPEDADKHSVRTSLFNLSHPLPAFEPDRLGLSNRGRDDVVSGLWSSSEFLEGPVDILDELREQIADVMAELAALEHRRAALQMAHGRSCDRSPEMFELAEQYCIVHAAAACFQFWLHNRLQLGEFFARGEWLVVALDRLLRRFQPLRPGLPGRYRQAVAEQLARLHSEQQLFSLVPFRLAHAD
jgi:alkylation response protein AidB-like acyl-CoA dehydrogenase